MGEKRKKKIVILGGGPGALSTAFYLSNTTELRDRFEVTIYQMGWRLGGKCSSGRNPRMHHRSEEHGIHGILGCYENSFDFLRDVFAQSDRKPEDPLSSCLDGPNPALVPWFPHEQRNSEGRPMFTNISLMEDFGENEWGIWPLTAPGNKEVPGDAIRSGDDRLDLWEALARMTSYLRFRLKDLKKAGEPAGYREMAVKYPKRAEGLPKRESVTPAKLLRDVRETLASGKANEDVHPFKTLRHISTLIWVLDEISDHLREKASPSDDLQRQLLIEIELWKTIMIGVLTEGCLHRGFGHLDCYEFTAWLKEHGASEGVLHSALAEAITSAAFGYSSVDQNRTMSASTTLRLLMRLFFDFRTSFLWEMQAGMGETVIMPIYEVLIKNGVKVEFFHRVDRIVPEGQKISKIELTRQVELAKPYNPVLKMRFKKGTLPCWSTEPDYGQLSGGQREVLERLKTEESLDLESVWFPNEELAQWQKKITLSRCPDEQSAGGDFDHVVIAMPVASLKFTCHELGRQNERWRNMLDQAHTVQTCAAQLYTKRTPTEMGWTGANPVMMLSFKNPLDTSADYSVVLQWEEFPESMGVVNATYFVNTVRDQPTIPIAWSPAGRPFPAEQNQKIKDECCRFILDKLPTLWPDFTTEDLAGREGKNPVDEQHYKANINPSDRYTLSPPGKAKYRLAPGDSQFDNLTLAGDWTDNHIHVGSFEGTIMSGKMAARAVGNSEVRIYAETDVRARSWLVKVVLSAVFDILQIWRKVNPRP